MCEHLSSITNQTDCEEKAEYRCICCGAGVCSEHRERACPYGGEGYIDI